MNKEEFFERMINRICKDYGYDVASTFELIYMTKEKEAEEKDKEIERLNNIIDEALGIANERVNYYHHKKMEAEDWTEIFGVLVKRDNLELKEGNKDE